MQHDVGYEAEQGPSQRIPSECRSASGSRCGTSVTSLALTDGLIFAFSVLQCIIGSLLVTLGVISVPIVPHYTSSTALPVWLGSITILAGGIGCILRRNKSKCLIGAALALSITAFILSCVIMVLYSTAYSHFDNLRDKSVSAPHKQWCLSLIMLIIAVNACEVMLSSVTVPVLLAAGWNLACSLFPGCCKFDRAEENHWRDGPIELKHSDPRDEHPPTQDGELSKEMGVNVINETPGRRNHFPFLLNHSLIFQFSVVKCVNGSFLNIIALVNVLVIGINASNFAIPLWCGILILINGVVGSLLKQNANKCLVGGFCALSISSLVVSVAALAFYTKTWVDISLSHYRKNTSPSNEDWSALVVLCLVIVDCISSVSSVVLSCEAYWKFCSTCKVGDCFTCLGCCECDTTPLYKNPGTIQKKAHRFKNTVAPICEDNNPDGVTCTHKAKSSHAHTGKDKDLQETVIKGVPALVNIFVGNSGVSSYDVLLNTGDNNFLKNSSGLEEEAPEISINIKPANAKQ